MKKRKWHLIVFFGLALILVWSVVACTKPKDTPYAPEFTLQTIKGETVSLSDFRGKPIMLNFWQINCPACQFQMPFTQAVYDELSNETAVILTINIGDRPSAVQDFVASRGITYPVLLDRQGEVAQTYGIPGVPMTFFIDGAGIIKAYKIGAFKSREEMETAFKSVFPSLIINPKTETSPEIGSLAPDFTLQTINGQNITLSEFRGKTVLLNFWVSSCAACIDDLPYFQIAFDGQANEEPVILATNCGESSQTVHSIVDDMELTFPVLLDPEGRTCTEYKHGAPTTFLIDSKGIIRAIKDDAFESPGEIESMLDFLQ